MPKTSPLHQMLEVSGRAIDKAVAGADRSLGSIYGATAGPGPEERQRSTRRSDELLAQGDTATVERVRAYGPFLSKSERREVNRRATAAGGVPVFEDA
jgi:hypothetical protein